MERFSALGVLQLHALLAVVSLMDDCFKAGRVIGVPASSLSLQRHKFSNIEESESLVVLCSIQCEASVEDVVVDLRLVEHVSATCGTSPIRVVDDMPTESFDFIEHPDESILVYLRH